MYTGHIYNNEGIALEGIKVSDGRNIATTDASGYYSLPGWEKANVISAQILTNHHNDWYRYIDKEHLVYDFYISPYSSIKKNDALFLHFSDTEIFIDGASTDQWIDFVKDVKNEFEPDFIIHTGDICRRRGLEAHHYAMNSDNMGIPVRYTLGNHDYVDDRYGEYTFERLYGPIWYSFDLGKVHFVVLPISEGEVKGLYSKDEMLIWLKNDLEAMDKSKRPIFLCHEPCKDFEEKCVILGKEEKIDLKEYDVLAWVFGHLHVDYVYESDGRFHIGTGRPDFGGIDGTPAGCRYIKIDEHKKLSTKVKYNSSFDNNCEVTRYVIGKGCCFTTPVYAEGDIFASVFDDSFPSECSIVRISTAGDIVWKKKMRSPIKWNIGYDNGVIYAKDDFGVVYALSAKSGDEIWTREINKNGNTTVCGGLNIQDGKIYTGTNSKAFILSTKSGEIITESEYSDNGVSASVSPKHIGDSVIWGKHWKGLICFDENGKTLWHNKDAIDAFAEPILVGDYIYAPSRYSIIKIDKNGNTVKKSEKHSEKFFNSTSTPLYYNGKLLVPSTECGLGIFDADTLDLIKYIHTSPSLIAAASYNPKGETSVFGTPIIDDDTLIFTAGDGKVYFCDLENFEIKRTVSIGHPILTGVTKTENGYCVTDFDGGISFIKK